MFVDIVLLVLAILCFLLGFVGCVLPALPGPPMCYVAMWLLQWSGYVHFGTASLVTWAVITIAVTVIDFFLTPWMTKRFGGSTAGSWGAVLGLVVGLFLPFPFGPLLGPFVGALIGEVLVSRKDTATATHAALGSFLSFFVGTGIKLLACGGMVAATIFAI